MNTPVSLEIAKLLKEKDVKITTESGYTYAFPTIADVVMWLYVKHGIWIECYIDDDATFGYLISRIIEERRTDSPLKRQYNSPTEAYKAAIEYTLNNLI